MNKVGIPPSFQEAIFATAAAVLHMGNIQFVEGRESDSSMVAPGAAQQHLSAVGKFLGGFEWTVMDDHAVSSEPPLYKVPSEYMRGLQGRSAWQV